MPVQAAEDTVVIDASGLHYRELNERIYQAAEQGARTIELLNINGQRYIAAGMRSDVIIRVHGTPGNDLGVFMDGPRMEVFGNLQDGSANTMNAGRIVVHGDAGQITGLSMRGGRVYIRGSVGYRSGIHMKGYEDMVPVVVIGGEAGAFLGEYMAGGRLYVLGLTPSPTRRGSDYVGGVRIPRRARSVVGMYTATGMHGGVIYIRGEVDPALVGKEVTVAPPDEEDQAVMRADLTDFAASFNLDAEEILAGPFVRLRPKSHRPYGKNYAY